MATRVLLPREQVFSNIGIVGSGYRLFFYETETTTKKDTYSDEELTTPNTNPVVADSTGRFGDIWISDSSMYKCVLAPAGTDDPSTNPIWTADPINAEDTGILIIDPLPTAYWGVTSGTSTAYLLDIPNLLVPITSYTNKQCFFVDFHIACGANPTININDLGILNLKKYTNSGTKIALEENDLQVQRSLAINDGIDIVILNPGIVYNLKSDNLTTYNTINGAVFSSKYVVISNNVSDANNDVDFAAGTVFDRTNNTGFVLSSITKRLDAAWVAGTGNGGLDTGTKANSTWYYCYAIYNPTTNIADAIFSVNNASPLLPSGYTRYSYLGSIRTDGSGNLLKFIQNGQHFDLMPYIQDRANIAAPTTPTTQVLTVPAKSNIIAKLSVHTQTIGANGSTYYLLVNPSYSSTTPSATNNTLWITKGTGYDLSCSNATILVPTNSSGEIIINATRADTLEINIIGWIDTQL